MNDKEIEGVLANGMGRFRPEQVKCRDSYAIVPYACHFSY